MGSIRRSAWLLALAVPFRLGAQVNVLTYQYDAARRGVIANETTLTPSNVNPSQFGKIATIPVDGVVYAQPLYLSNVDMGPSGVHNVLFVATEHDTVYAFDADTLSSSPLWQTSFLSSGVTTIPSSDTGCTHIVPEIGVSSTPVIDSTTGTLYVVASTKENGDFVHRLHALDVSTGAEKFGGPVVIQASVPGTGDGGSTVTFVARNYKQRIGLLLANGLVYIGFSSHCDLGSYHGWLLGYDAQTLQQSAVFNATPNGEAGAFWQGGAAPSADSDGNIYIASGNGTFDGQTNFGESYLKLSGRDLKVLDYFTPYNYGDLNNKDLDLGSAAAVLLPDQPGPRPHLMIGGGKGSRLYVIDRDNMGKIGSGSDSQIVSSAQASPLFGSGAFFNNTFYMCSGGDFLRAYPLSNGQLGASAMGKFSYTSPCVPIVSSNGGSDGIVWTLDRSNTLRAYDANNISNEIYDSAMNPSRDALGTYVKYSVPTIINGRVYAGTQNSIVVFGQMSTTTTLSVSNAASGEASVAAPGSLIAIKGVALTQTTATAQGFPLPLSLGNAAVTINGISAPLLYVSPGQINAQVPFEVGGGSAVLNTMLLGDISATAGLTIRGIAPGLFLSGNGQAAVINDSGAVNSPSQPAAAGSFVAAYLTGLGQVDNIVPTGAATPATPLSQTTTPVTATIGAQKAQVTFAGLAPGFAGLYQVNLIVPTLAPGSYPLQITIGGFTSNTGLISIR